MLRNLPDNASWSSWYIFKYYFDISPQTEENHDKNIVKAAS